MATNLSTLRNLLILTAALLAGLVVAFILAPRNSENNQLLAHKLGGDFTLQGIEGSTSLQDFRGKVVMLYIGYASCPDVCPTSLAVMSQSMKNLTAEESSQVQPIFISVDPDRDTPERLTEYSQFFHPSMIGLSGSRENLDQVVKQYGAFYRMVELKDSAMGYAVDHSSRIYLINRQGALKDTLMHGTMPTELTERLRELLATN